MNEDLEEFAHDAAAALRRFYLILLQALNGALITLGGIAVYVHGAYPAIEQQLLAKLPPALQFAAIALIGAGVHWLTRQAKKAGQ